MKKLLLSIAVLASGYVAYAQVVCAGVTPASIAGNYDFTWADPSGGDWGCPDFLIPGTFITGELVLVDDGTPGTSSVTGYPNGNYGCAPSPADAYLDKIAVVYRYDNSGTSSPTYCGFSDKALNAFNSGAKGVIIINREPGVVGMAGNIVGIDVTVPVVMLSDTDGAALRAEMANGPVTMFIGNKTGLYADDAGIVKGATLLSKSYGTPSQLSQDGTEFGFDLGTRVYNYGTNDQSNISITATIDGPSGNVYTETVTGISVISTDSADVIPGGIAEFPPFALASYPAGRYTLTYTVDLGTTDEYVGDNTITSDFVINDSIYSLAMLDVTTGLPVADNGYRPSTNTQTFGECIVLSNPNASRLGVDGIYFSAQASTVDLTGEEMALNFYQWDDAFVDLDDPNLAFDNLTPLAFGYFYYPSDQQGETVYGSFNTQVSLQDNQRYLACVQTVNLEVYLGFDTKTNYTWNEAYYLQPLTPIENDGAYFASGFGADIVPALGLRVFDIAELGMNEETTVDGVAYPNPATDVVTVSVKGEGNAIIRITDLAGRTVQNTTVSLVNGASTLNISELTSGAYIFNVTLEDGKTSQFNVVKK